MEEWEKSVSEIFGEFGIKTRSRRDFVELELPNGKKIEFGRINHGIGVDFFRVKIDGQKVHEG